jgi:hypothetical protein
MRRRIAAVVALAAACAGCATYPPVQQLAEHTAANAGVIGSHLRDLAEASRALAARRASNVARLHAANAQGRAAYRYDVALTRRAGGEADLRLIDDVAAWAAQVQEIFAAAHGAEERRRAEVLATQAALDTRAEALGRIAQALATLARDDSAADRVRFLGGYARQLAAEIQKQLEQDTSSARAANQLLEQIQDSLGKATP